MLFRLLTTVAEESEKHVMEQDRMNIQSSREGSEDSEKRLAI